MQAVLERQVQQAIKWGAAEYYYFKELEQDLGDLKRDLAIAKTKASVKDIKAAFHDFHYIGRAEARLYSSLDEINKLFEELLRQRVAFAGPFADARAVVQRLQVEADTLVRNASRYEGKIRELLLHLKDKVEHHQIERAQQVLAEVGELIADTEKWLAAIAVDLKKAKAIVQQRDFGKRIEADDPQLEDFENGRTQAAVMNLLQEYGLWNIDAHRWRYNGYSAGGKTITSDCGPRIEREGLPAKFGAVWVSGREKLFRIHFLPTQSPLYEHPGDWSICEYQPDNVAQRKQYPSFKDFLVTYLLILRRAITEGWQSKKFIAALAEAKLFTSKKRTTRL